MHAIEVYALDGATLEAVQVPPPDAEIPPCRGPHTVQAPAGRPVGKHAFATTAMMVVLSLHSGDGRWPARALSGEAAASTDAAVQPLPGSSGKVAGGLGKDAPATTTATAPASRPELDVGQNKAALDDRGTGDSGRVIPGGAPRPQAGASVTNANRRAVPLPRRDEFIPAVPIAEPLPRRVPAPFPIPSGTRATLELHIDRRGRVTTARILKSDGSYFNTPLLRAARAWRYVPASLEGRPVESVRVVQVRLR
jgi:TonB family protein